MKDLSDKIWELALPFQDKRDDKGHASVTFNYAKQLLKTEKGDKKIVLPAIILHDTGWSKLTKEERMVIFDKNATKEDKLKLRYKHQNEGVIIAKNILKQIKYPKKLTREILEIISEHDTRQYFLSQNEGIVRDADKLWRFSEIGFSADIKRYKFSFEQLEDKLIKRINTDNFFFSGKAKEIAYEELRNRKLEYC